MKEKLALIRSEIEKLVTLALESDYEDDTPAADAHEALLEVLDSLEPLVEHLDDFDDFDTESWIEDLRQMIAELDD